MTHPPEETAPGHIDYMETPLPDIVLRQQERLRQAEARYERLDLANCALERYLAYEVARGTRTVSTTMLLDLLGAAARYGSCSLRGAGIDELLADLEAELEGR